MAIELGSRESRLGTNIWPSGRGSSIVVAAKGNVRGLYSSAPYCLNAYATFDRLKGRELESDKIILSRENVITDFDKCTIQWIAFFKKIKR